MTFITVFKSENYRDKNRLTRKVQVVRESGHVNIQAWGLGPRGGFYHTMGPGFSEAEWKIITERVAEVHAARENMPEDFYGYKD